MLSKNQIKFITGLHHKKYRDEHKLFLAEGFKTISELLESHIPLQELYTTEPLKSNVKQILITEKELAKISTLKTPNKMLGIFKMPSPKPIDESKLIVALDAIRDPGNLGTIIRLCDWFGIDNLVCSHHTADCYNPKVIQSSMGSIARINVTYLDLEDFLKSTTAAKWGAFMEGGNVYQTKLPSAGILVMGNEANGISPQVEAFIDHRISIPRFGELQQTESLNVATATAILLSEFRRNTIER